MASIHEKDSILRAIRTLDIEELNLAITLYAQQQQQPWNVHNKIKSSRLSMVTPLRYAVRHWNLAAVQLFCRMGADINEVIVYGRDGPLYLMDYASVWRRCATVMAYLFERGARYNPQISDRTEYAQKLLARLERRVAKARLAVVVLLSHTIRHYWGRDIAGILARLVWWTRRWPCWDYK